MNEEGKMARKMKLEYEDRRDGLYRCVDCEMGFHAWHPSGASDASSCCPHRKYERYSRIFLGRFEEIIWRVGRLIERAKL